MSFNLTRDNNNKTIKKKISFSQTPKITSNKIALSNTNSVNLQQLSINSVPITASGNNINTLDTIPGTASSNKAIVLDQNKNINNINTITTNSLTVNNESITGIYQNNNPSNSNSPYIKGMESGLSDYNKLVTTDNNNNLKTINNISSNSLTLNKNNITFINKGTSNVNTNPIDGDYISFTENYKFNSPISLYIESVNVYIYIVNNYKIYRSTNQINWSLCYYTRSDYIRSIAYSETNNVIVVAHNNNKLSTSLDYGLTWTSQTLPTYTFYYYFNYSRSKVFTNEFHTICWSPLFNKFHAIAYSRELTGLHYQFYYFLFTSTNGINWDKYTILDQTYTESYYPPEPTKLIWNNNRQRFEMYFDTYTVSNTTFNGRIFYSTGSSSYSYYNTTNIKMWVPDLQRYYGTSNGFLTYGSEFNTMNNISNISNQNIIWISSIQKFMYISNIGNQNRIFLISPNLDKIYISNITQLTNLYLTNYTDENNNPLYSLNNRYYTLQTNINVDLDFNKLSVYNNNLNNGFKSICRSDSLNLFVAITNTNSNQQIATSSDGINWILRNTPNNNWTSVCWSKKLNLFVAVADSGTNRIIKSNNGIDWTTNTINYYSNKPKATRNNIAIGSRHSLFLLENGIIYGCGYSSYLGTSNSEGTGTSLYVSYTNVDNINTAIAIAAGLNHSLALLSNGTIKSWGSNGNGQLGNNTVLYQGKPVDVSNITNAIAISAGANYSLALLSNGTIMSWGLNTNGQLGNNSNTNSSIPVLVSNITNAIAISAGGSFSLALLSNGTIMSWGDNQYGQLGNENNNNSNIPVLVSNINNAIAISAGLNHSLALLSDGTVKSWGVNDTGKLGNGNVINSNIPVSVININNCIEISATGYNSYFLDSNYLLYGCGTGAYIGNNYATGNYNTPNNITYLSNVISLAQGSLASHMIILTISNSLFSWGYSYYGQLGNNSINTTYIPVSPLDVDNKIYNEVININYITNDLSYINNNWISIIWNNTLQLFAALSNNGTNNNIMTSYDGINWYSQYTPSNIEWTNLIIYNNDYIFIAYCSKITTTNIPKILYSLNGIVWNTFYSTTKKILWINNGYLALDSGSNITVNNGFSFSNNLFISDTITKSNTLTLSSLYNYKQYYIDKFNINIYISNEINTIYYTYDSLNFFEYDLSKLTNISNWTDLYWSDSLNYFILVSSINNSNQIIKSLSSSMLQTTEALSIIPRNKYNNRFNDINILFAYTSATTCTYLVWIKEFNLFYSNLGKFNLTGYRNTTNLPPNNNVAYSPTLNLFVSGSSIPSTYSNGTVLGVSTSSDGINWTSRAIPTTTTSNFGNWSISYWSPELNCFFLGNISTGIASDNTNRILISTDGINWTSVLQITTYNIAITGFVWVKKFKMLLTNINYSTTNGTNWGLGWFTSSSIAYSPILDKFVDTTLVTNVTSSYYLDDINLFIALTSSNSISISTNGSNWKSYTTPATFNKLIWVKELGTILFTTSAASFNPIYICNLYTNNINLSYFNSNSITNYKNNLVNNWYIKNTPSNTWKYIVYSIDLNLFVAISNSGNNDRIMTSNDGWNWISRTSPADNDWTSICYSSDLELFVAVSNTGSNNRVMTSNDGINWTTRISAANNNWTSICYSPELTLFVAVSNSGSNNRVMTSSNGINWTSRISIIDNNWTSICYSPDLKLFVAVSNSGSNNRVMTSLDGIIWTSRISAANNNWTSVCWASSLGLFIAIANSGIGNRIMTSNDGIIWISRTSPVDNNWTSICYADELNLVIAIANSGSNRIMKSNDGINWITMSIENKDWQSICWAKELGIFVTISSSNSNNDIAISNIAVIGIHNNILGIDSIISSTHNGSNKALRLGGNNGNNSVLNLNSNSNNELLRLTYNNSNTNYTNLDLNSTGNQLNIEVNGTNKIFNIVNHNSINTGLILQNTLLTATANDLNKLDSEFGIASNSKILSVNNDLNISNINNLGLNKIFINNTLLLTNNDINSSYIQNITPGISNSLKCIVPDSDLNITNLNTLNSKIININKTNIINEPSLIDYKFNKTLNNGKLLKKYPSNINVYSICWSPELSIFVAVGDCWNNENGSFYKIMTSPDSINWESKYIFYTGTLTSVCWSPELSLFVAVGTSGRIITSIDGNIWITRSSSGNNWSSICWSSSLNLFVIIANSGTYRISISSNGITWTSQTSFTNTSNWSSIVWASGLSVFVAVANSGITTTQIATSPNGTTWTLQTSPVANTWTSISYSSSLNLLVAVSNSGTGNRVMTSSNGILWTSRISAADNNWTSICWASGLSLFIAIANNGTNTRMMKSSNGTSWTLIDTTNLNIDYNVIIYSSNLNLLIAGGISSGLYSNNKIVTSSDSNTWILKDTNYDGWNKILWVSSLNSYIGCASSNGYMKRIIKSSNGIDWSLFSTNIINDYNSYLIQDIIFVSELNLFIGIGNTFIIYSSNADFWSNCLLPSGTLNLRSIIWSSSLNLLVAVGNSGTMASRILTSSDGINWTLQTHPLLTGSWYSITWSSSLNLFAIVSYSNYYNQVITSPDGINWTLRTTSSNAFILSSITWISQLNLFIATSNNSYILKSSDGITWTSSIIYTNEGIALSSIVNQLLWINKYNILVGISINGNSQNTLVYTYDTITWYTITLPYFNNNSYSSIVYSNDLEQFIIYTNSSINSFAPFITYDLNSIVQDSSLSINLNNISNLIKPNNTMVNNAINNWNSINYIYSNNLTCICYSSYLKLFVAVANSGTGNRVMTSTNGTTWTIRTSAADNNWTSICWSFKLKLFVVVSNSGTNNRIMTSSNGTSWTSRTSPADNNWTSICYSSELNLFVAVANSGTNNRFMISSNGINWGTITVNNNNDWNSICWSPELSLFVAIASTGTNNRIITSNNGFDWVTRNNPVDNNWTSICWASELSLFVAVANTGTNDRIMTSSDGITWISRTNPVDNNWTSICWAPEIMSFIVVANSGINNRIMKSNDGINWSINSINYNLNYTPSLTFNTIAGGNNHTLIVLNSNTVSVIGSNSNGQLCESTTTTSRTSSIIISSNLYNVIKVSAGFNFSLVLLSNGTIQGFGRNDYGQLGDNSTIQRTSQVNILGINNAIDISSGPSSHHSLALLNDNTVKSWGNNFYGQLGNNSNIGTNTANSTPYLIPDLNNIIMIKTGNNHSIALLSDGTIKCWGLNDRGQLGDGTTTNSSSPVTVSGINNAIAIAAGDKHSIALLSDGTIKAWGSNEFNQLGNSTNAGTTTANSSPLSVLNITNAIAIASGSYHCLALLNDNTVRSWGRNTDGQLGNGSTVNSFTPVTVTSLTNVIGISAGDIHSIALRNDGSIRTWGDGTLGKLGNGATTDSTSIYGPSIYGIAKFNLTSDSNYANNDWMAICWNPDLEIFAAVSNTGTNNRIILSSNDSILSKETVIKNLNNSFNIDQNNDRIGLNISNPSYQLHLSSSNATKPGTSTWTVSSDIRLKENIEDADLDLCYNNIKNLPLKKYKWKDEYLTIENVPDRHKLGWIAQDVETILPKSVKITEQYGLTDCKVLNTDQIIAHMHGCVKKLLNIYENQNNKMNNLNQDINNMKTFINNLS